jgi:surface polysaccharide O-acyltransferase-like enzyme
MTFEKVSAKMNLMNTLESKQTTRIYGFDYLRAIACIFVVAFHSSPFPMQNIFAKTLHVFLFASAVPVFVIMSLFLTESKGFHFKYVVGKSRSLLKTYVFWGWILPAILYFIYRSLNIARVENSLQIKLNLYDWFFNGLNWPLKVHGIYFLPFLFILTWIYFVLQPHINSYLRAACLFVVLFTVNLSLPFLPENLDALRHSVIPFLIYIPLTKILFLDYQQNCNYLKKGLYCFMVYLVIALSEGSLIIAEKLPFIPLYHYSPYGRLSIVFLAAALVYWAFLIRYKIENFSETLRILMYCSLGIYLIHGFVLDFILLEKYELSLFMIFLSVLSISIFLSSLIRDIPYVKKVLIL